AVVIEGVASEPVTISIRNDEVTLLPAAGLWGKGNFAAVAQLRQEYPGQALITIGPAGEKGLKAAGVFVTTPDYFLRAAARGGLGTVLGTKKVKAIVIDSDGPGVSVAEPEQFKAVTRELTATIVNHPLSAGLKAFGTPLLIGLMNQMGGLATRNFSRGTFAGAEKIGGEAFAKVLGERKNAHAAHGCMRGCVVQCSQVYTNPEGEVITSGLEFETVGLAGSNCEIDDLDAIARFDQVCDDVGLDTIDVACAIGVAMEAGRIPWGDSEKLVSVVESIRTDDPLGLLIGNGCAETGKALGVARTPVVKGQALSAYDPRILKGTGVTYATATMGADHTCGNAIPNPSIPDYDAGSPQGQHEMSGFLQSWFAAIDSLGLCLFASLPLLDNPPDSFQKLADLVGAKLGEKLTPDYIMGMGRGVCLQERKFNELAGFGPADDRLPSFFRQELLLKGGSVFDVSDEDLDRVYGD
ncbi:MAG: aldehyde ferredoxin oxidoreductase, partial [Desulfuromonadales bacterium]|nr:aldehyde ferredoxin oxidoreductase [Desulfuromonadales bacterium]